MPGDDPKIGVDEDRRIKAELFYRTSDLPDLLFAVLSRIARIEFQSINRLVNNSRQTVARLLAASREQVRTHVLKAPERWLPCPNVTGPLAAAKALFGEHEDLAPAIVAGAAGRVD